MLRTIALLNTLRHKPRVRTTSMGGDLHKFHTRILACDADARIAFHESTAIDGEADAQPLTNVHAHISSTLTRTSLELAAAELRAGGVVAFPTETVYGLGAIALNETAVRKVFAVKGRPGDNPLIVHVCDMHMLRSVVHERWQLGEVYGALVRRFWPGGLTLLCPVNASVPGVVTAGGACVAVRMPSNPIARALIDCVRFPLAAPSANASGRPSPTTAEHVLTDLDGRLAYILDAGACEVGVESTVVDGITAQAELRILRPGAITVEQIATVLVESGLANKVKLRVYGKDMQRCREQETNPTTPGMKYRHYCPTARVVLLLPTSPDESPVSIGRCRSWTHIVGEQIRRHVDGRMRDAEVHVGLMMTSDSHVSRLVASASTPTSTPMGAAIHPHLLPPRALAGLDGVTLHAFDLGPSAHAEVYAQRLFDGLRTLDEGPLHGAQRCDLILVEALDDAGVGLAVMNRLRKAASETVVLEC